MEPLIGHSISTVCEPMVTGTHVLDEEWQTVLLSCTLIAPEVLANNFCQLSGAEASPRKVNSAAAHMFSAGGFESDTDCTYCVDGASVLNST